MGKSLPSPTRFQEFARFSSKKLCDPKTANPISKNQFFASEPSKNFDFEKSKLKMENPQKQNRIPLAAVVSDCARRWFQDTLKEAKGGDIPMQVLVGQMYYSGYGTPRDVQRGKAWITKASKNRSSALKIGAKRPGYNLSDSDSEDEKDNGL